MGKMDEDAVRKRLEQDAADEALAKKLDSDPDFAKDFDDSFIRGFNGFEADLLKKIADDKGMSEKERAAMLEAAERAKKAMKGGWFSSANPAEAEKIIMSNRGLREAKKRSGKGCTVVALLFLGSSATAVGTLWAAADAIVRALS